MTASASSDATGGARDVERFSRPPDHSGNLVLIATLLALTETGPGPLSFDRDRLSGPGWALAALLGGIAGAAGAHAYSAAQPEPQPQAAPPNPETAPKPEPVGAAS